jgi:hypothetical protein
VPIADPSLLLSLVAPRPTDAATVDGAAATIPGSTAIPAVTGIIDLPVDGAGAVTVTPDGRQAWITLWGSRTRAGSLTSGDLRVGMIPMCRCGCCI